MLSEGWKCYFRDPIFQNLPREHASGRTPLASQAFGARDCPSPPPPALPINLTLLRHFDLEEVY